MTRRKAQRTVRPLDPNELLKDMMQADLMDAQASYLARGRALENLPADELQRRWAEALLAVAREYSDQRMQAVEDATAEMGLRGDTVAASQIPAEVKNKIRREYTLDDAGLRQVIGDSIREYVQKRTRPN